MRPCRHVMCRSLFEGWMSHLCGLCLTLRAEHGQAARLVTNYDGLLVSVLAEAQNAERSPHRKAGPCVLRGMRSADVVDAKAEGARLAAAVSLMLAAAKTRDHVLDRDRGYARPLVAAGASRLADRWDAAGARTGSALGFDVSVLRDAVDRQAELERTGGVGLLELTEPTETAVAAAFAHTAVLAGKPHNAEALAEAGRFFGRLAHLVDAVEDLAEDQATGAYNPLLATGTSLAEARRYCDDALHGLRLAVADLDLENDRLVRALLDREIGRSVEQVFAAYPPPGGPQGPYGPPPQGPYGSPPQHHQQARHPYPAPGGPGVPPGGGGGWSGGGGGWGHGGGSQRPGLPIPCFTFTVTTCTCGLYQPRWSKYHKASCGKRCWCTRHDCCDGCDCCSCDC
ncbi:DUF5685 family protein [Thermomonospora amylolytica]|uniref:DUF5685 family protein n=1 Tax=Thermomonospora amylolytica TaxID=1411117 RepID=UPI002D771B32|nr:DUF5685 family protein [Thermomonospora amylolytica]